MKHLKKKLSLIVTIYMLVLSIGTSFFVMPVKADTSTNLQNAINKANELKQNIADGIAPDANGINTIIKTLLLPAGFIAGTANFTVNQLRDIYSSIIDSNDTDEQALKKINDNLGNNITINDNSLTFNSTSKSLLVNYANAVQEETGIFYGYTINWSDSITTYPSGTMYNTVKNYIQKDQLSYYINTRQTYGSSSGISTVWLYSYPKSADIAFVKTSKDNTTYSVTMYNPVTWDRISGHEPTGSNGVRYIYNGQLETLSSNDVFGGYGNYFDSGKVLINENDKIMLNGNSGGLGGTGYFLSYGGKQQILIYSSVEVMKLMSQGQKPYYVGDKWSNFQSNVGNTIDNSNCNNINYGDVTNYINNNSSNSNDIYNYINGNDSGGGSGGGGSGDDPIFDLGFLGTIGRLIGSLITGIGNLLTGIFEGIVNVITNILDFLTTTISDITVTLPEQFFGFIGAIFNWLPEPMMNTIKALFVFMVLIGVLNIIRK